MDTAIDTAIDTEPCRPALASTIITTVAVGALAGLTLWGTWGDDPAPRLALDIVVAALSIALTAVTPRRPVAGGLALSILVALSPVATPAATLAVLQVARLRRFPVALGVAAAGVAGQAVQGWWRPTGGLSYGWWLLLMTAAYAALAGWGALAQARAALLDSLRDRARRAEAEQERRVVEARLAERTRIAREMHDVLAHRLSLLATYAGALEYRPDAPPEQLAAAAGVVRVGVHQALEELRQVVLVLRQDDGVPASGDHPVPLLADLDDLVTESRDAGVRIQLDNRIAGGDEPPAPVGRTAYRVVQEALTNARKHATGQPVLIVLDGTPGERLRIDVRNPLPGHSATPPIPDPGVGLIGLAERLQLIGGGLDQAGPSDGEFRLRAWLPWK